MKKFLREISLNFTLCDDAYDDIQSGNSITFDIIIVRQFINKLFHSAEKLDVIYLSECHIMK